MDLAFFLQQEFLKKSPFALIFSFYTAELFCPHQVRQYFFKFVCISHLLNHLVLLRRRCVDMERCFSEF